MAAQTIHETYLHDKTGSGAIKKAMLLEPLGL